jgi:hypothetical protein
LVYNLFTTTGTIVYELLTLLLAGTIFIHAAFHVRRLIRDRHHVGSPALITGLGWLAISIFVLTLWPNSSYPGFYARSSFLFFTTAILFPIAIFHTRPLDSATPFHLKNLGRIGIALICLVLVYSMIRYLLFLRPVIVASDLFYYVCTARDMSQGFSDLSLLRYFYFPGVYTFWRIVLRLTDGTLNSLQWCYLGLVAANAIIVGGIVWRTVSNLFASVLAIVWYLVFCSNFSGFTGMVEPIATLPILVGLLLWGGNSLVGKTGVMRVLALGIGLGLGVYVRQLAGLISLGAISLVLTYLFQDQASPIIRLKQLVLLPLVSATVVLLGILLEGYGFQPLMIGTQHFQEYGRSGSFSVIWNIGRSVPLLTGLSFIALFLWIFCLAFRRFRSAIVSPWWQMVCFTSIGGFLSLLSHIVRAATHYTLIPGPLLIISSVISFVMILRAVPIHYRTAPAFYFLIAMIAFLPLVQSNSPTTFYVWPVSYQWFRPIKQIPWSIRPATATDLQYLKKQLKPFEKIYVLPPSHNELHFFLQTRFPSYGYFYKRPLAEVLQTPGLDGVIVLNRSEVTPFYRAFGDRMFQYDRANEILTSRGFEPVVKLSTMVLWRKVVIAEVKVNPF